MTVQEPALCFLSGMCGIFVPIIGFQAGRKYLGVPILEMFAQRSNYGMSMRFCAGACREMRGAHILIILSPDPVQNFDFKLPNLSIETMILEYYFSQLRLEV